MRGYSIHTYDPYGGLKTGFSSIPVHTHQGATEGGTLDAAAVASGTLPTVRGGTGQDLSAATGVIVVAGGVVSTKTNPSSAFAGIDDSQTLKNKKLEATTVTIADPSDPTKLARFDVSAISAAATRIFTLPDSDGPVIISSHANATPNSGLEVWANGPTSAPRGWTLLGSGASVAREATIVKSGSYSAALTRAGTDCQFIANSTDAYGGQGYFRGRKYTVGAWVYATAASRARLYVRDGVSTYTSSYHSGGSTWEYLTVTFTANASATLLEYGLEVANANTTAYIDNMVCVEGDYAPNWVPHVVPFSSLPHRVTLWHDEAIVTAGNAIAIVTNTSQAYNNVTLQSSGAQNDAFSHGFWLRGSAAYVFSVLGATTPPSAQIMWSIDGEDFATVQDWYSASNTFNVVKTTSSVAVKGDGYHVLRGRIPSRNGSNTTGWNMALNKYWFRLASD